MSHWPAPPQNNGSIDQESPFTWCIWLHIYDELVYTGIYHMESARLMLRFRFSDQTDNDVRYWYSLMSVKLKYVAPIRCGLAGNRTWTAETAYPVSVFRYEWIKSPSIHSSWILVSYACKRDANQSDPRLLSTTIGTRDTHKNCPVLITPNYIVNGRECGTITI